jgi:predicted transcriptional regulator YdeE
LVPYNDVWVTGAHTATTLEVDKNFIVAGKVIPKGKYAIFTIPGKIEWIIIINKNWNQHLTDDYLQKEDVVRIKVKPVKQAKSTERLQYYIKNGTGNKGTIAMAWERLKVEFPISIKG